MLDRELTYHVPFERLVKLSRTMSRKAFGGVWWATWLLIAVFIAACFAGPFVEGQLVRTGLPDGAGVFVLIALFFAGLFAIRRWAKRQSRSRADYGAEVKFRQEAGGLRVGTNNVEYFFKWAGIAQVLIEPDGLVFSHGNLFFLVPNSAFATLGERDELAREIFANLGEDAKDRSVPHLPPAMVRAVGGA
ncbi:MAG: YcxB family protein [Hyphomicrobium sp.]|uniref:YcxB family protein n=1 Tax=Hyphomicrobium sp. TaxID=82 RepID=UPI003D0D27A3